MNCQETINVLGSANEEERLTHSKPITANISNINNQAKRTMKRKMLNLVALLGLLSTLNSQFSTVLATTRTVTSLLDSGTGSLRERIGLSAASDTVNFSVNGTITLTSEPLVITNDLTIIGPAAGLTVSGNRARNVFGILSGTVNISNLTQRLHRDQQPGLLRRRRRHLEQRNADAQSL